MCVCHRLDPHCKYKVLILWDYVDRIEIEEVVNYSQAEFVELISKIEETMSEHN